VPGNLAAKPMLGSPLKRGFTAAMNGNGFTYLKKRKLSNETPLSQSMQPNESRLAVRDENVARVEQGSVETVSRSILGSTSYDACSSHHNSQPPYRSSSIAVQRNQARQLDPRMESLLPVVGSPSRH
jgi:hypothetical protein